MKVWQAGSHLSDARGARVEDWSWRQTRRRLAALARLARPYPGRSLLAVVTLLAFTLVALLPPYLAKLAIDDGISDGDLGFLTLAVTLFLLAGAAAFALSGFQTYFTGWVGERGLADLRIRLFAHLQRLSLGYYERNRTGAIVSRITNDVEALDMLVTDGLASLVQNTLLLGGTVVVLFLLDWRLALATLVVIPFMGWITAWFRRRSNRAYRRVRERLGRRARQWRCGDANRARRSRVVDRRSGHGGSKRRARGGGVDAAPPGHQSAFWATLLPWRKSRR